MRETFKNAVIQNIGKIIAGLIVTTLLGVFTTIVIEPVKQVVNMPGEVREAMHGLNNKQQQLESRQMMLFKTLEKQSETDSAIFKQLEKLNSTNIVFTKEMSVIQAKLATIRDELPALHQRFNDIENTVKNIRSYGDYAHQPTATKFTKERFNHWRQQKEWQRNRYKYYDKIRSRNPRLMYLDSLNNAQSLNIAYQSSFNSYYNEQQTTN
ncbi:hypothetical protein [Saccharicrinis sp. GN24d3]|uniref:hypothetical protein n=1 Tax=Saccharicrinis sp. GN24d3 TaxID=3458416 RepID=UPI004035930E